MDDFFFFLSKKENRLERGIVDSSRDRDISWAEIFFSFFGGVERGKYVIFCPYSVLRLIPNNTKIY